MGNVRPQQIALLIDILNHGVKSNQRDHAVVPEGGCLMSGMNRRIRRERPDKADCSQKDPKAHFDCARIDTFVCSFLP